MVRCSQLIRQDTEAKFTVQVGISSSLPRTRGPVCPGRLWAVKLHKHSPAALRCLGSFSATKKPHSGRADSISHLARDGKEGLGSWSGGGRWD